jgi:hypothetical protein
MAQPSRILTRRGALAFIAAGLIVPALSAAAQAPTIIVHKDPNCGCCGGWVQHLKDAGFAVTVEETAVLRAIRKRLGVPADLAACHTAEIAGYIIEGHVPAPAIRQLLEKRPVAVGLAVPGMPAGSPGMEGGTPQKYDVILFGAMGRETFMQFIGSQAVS